MLRSSKWRTTTAALVTANHRLVIPISFLDEIVLLTGHRDSFGVGDDPELIVWWVESKAECSRFYG